MNVYRSVPASALFLYIVYRSSPVHFYARIPSYNSSLRRSSIVRHLENLQRKGGFKGFNQHAVSLIIAETDPRKQGAH